MTEDQIEAAVDCPYDCEECSDSNRCDRCRSDAFVRDVAKLVFGNVQESGSISEVIVLAELDLLVQKAKRLNKENTEQKAKLGKMGIEIDRLKAELIREKQKGGVGADIAIRASDALSKMQAAYGDDLSWDNIVERATGALVRLQTQAPLLQAAEGELQRMRARLAELDPVGPTTRIQDRLRSEGRIPPIPEFRAPSMPEFRPPPMPEFREVPPPFDPPPADIGAADRVPPLGDANSRLDSLEQDMAFLRLISRLGGRLLGLDRPRGTR